MDLIENREEMYQFILTEIMPKYNDLLKCTMHIPPRIMGKDIEYIFNVTFNATLDDRNKWENEILKELQIEFDLDEDNLNKILLIFKY